MLGVTPRTRGRIVFGIVVLGLLGLGLGYAVGMMTRPQGVELGVERPPVAYATDAMQADGQGNSAAPGIPGWRDLYVNDYADLLDDDAETRIRAQLEELYEYTGVEMTVLTIARRSDYGFEGTNEAFATRLFNTWGIGNAEANDGVLILVSRFDREMRIELGAGYGSARDDDMQWVIDEYFLPNFRADRYQIGIEQGVEGTIREIAGVSPGQYESSTLWRGFSTIGRGLESLGGWLWGLLLVPLGGAAWTFRRWLRYRPRDCGTCGTRMVLQNEDVDDAHLSGGQRLEEFVRSVDYDVYECPSCNRMEISRYPAWFSSYGTCPQCDYRTMSSDTEILEAATTTSTGRKRIDYQCHNCKFTDSEVRTIPKVSKSSSSGSGRSSFGGGSSSGGGASGSW
ncbi:TPM domain-containing protein [Oceanibium sediminis]|uniref:TPM domain-containing protein n=1 Tax=Oceanibium sediminis TaxID=2026339 RepID=UPI000DD3AF83|nr:TPM domain-containing protein [Oceanibium sediminis]